MVDARNARRYSPEDWEFRASKERLFLDDGPGYAVTDTDDGEMYMDELIMSRVPQPSAEHTEIIHVDGNTLDNRFPNMRWGTRAEFIAWNADCADGFTNEYIFNRV
jgi:hypothetical protein